MAGRVHAMEENTPNTPDTPDFLIKEILPDYLDEALTDPEDREYAEMRLTSILEEGFWGIEELKKAMGRWKKPAHLDNPMGLLHYRLNRLGVPPGYEGKIATLDD